MKSLIRAGAALAALVASTAAAQDAPTGERPWAIYGTLGGDWSSGGGHGTLMGPRYSSSIGLRFRLEDGPWWVGVEMVDWVARATAAGFDSIAVREDRSNATHDRSAAFTAVALQVVARHDLMQRGPLDAYALATVGVTQSQGQISGSCFTNQNGFPICTEAPIVAHGPGMTFTGSLGLGTTLNYSAVLRPIPRWIRWALGQHLMLEVTGVSQEATEGRFTAVRGLFGIGW